MLLTRASAPGGLNQHFFNNKNRLCSVDRKNATSSKLANPPENNKRLWADGKLMYILKRFLTIQV